MPSPAALLLLANLHRAHDGGTLKLTADSSFGTIDPQVNYQSKAMQIEYILYDGLVTVRRANNDPGVVLVPDLAAAMPTIQDHGRAYTFPIRRNIYFSNGRLLTEADVVASFVRMFKVHSPNVDSWFATILGAQACLANPTTCTLRGGVVADPLAHTVTFHLATPDPEFLYKLSLPTFCILPADTPAHDLGTTAPPGTGAYTVDRYDPTRQLHLSRNPYFHEFSADAQPRGYVDAIDYRFGLQDESEVTAVLNGQYDWMYEPKPLDRLTELGTTYADRVHIGQIPYLYYVPLNVNLDPFDSADARLAFAYGVDRRAIVKLYGGTHLATPMCNWIPAGIPAHTNFCPFTLNPGAAWSAPDMTRAHQLMRASGKIGHDVTIIVQDIAFTRAAGEYLRSFLQQLGFHAHLKAISAQIQFSYIQNTGNHVQASLTDWTDDYPSPSDYLNVLFSCGSFHPGSDSSVNMAGICNPALDRGMQAALDLEGVNPAAANTAWTSIDHAITATAAQVSLIQVNELTLVSARLGHYTWSPVIHMIFAQVWVQ